MCWIIWLHKYQMQNNMFRKFEHHVPIFEGGNGHSMHSLPIAILSMLIPVSPLLLSHSMHSLWSAKFPVDSKTMGISRGSLHKKRSTRGKKKRKNELGRQPSMTKLSSNTTMRRVCVRGGEDFGGLYEQVGMHVQREGGGPSQVGWYQHIASV